MATVLFDKVTKSYGAVEALKEFSLEVDDGDFCVFVGPSGCGKSTALKMLAGLEPTTSGAIHVGGRDVTELGPGKRDIAMVFQNYALYPHMTVRKNIGFGLKMRGVPQSEIDEKVMHASDVLELTEYLNRKPRALSGGQRQRVALGRAIVRQPSVFLMDEPLSNLDAKLRVQTRSEIVNLQRRLGVTTIYVTHDQTEALTMASKIVVIRNGRIQQVGTSEDLFSQPRNIFVAGFIGSPGMNFFKGVVNVTDQGVTTTFGGQTVNLPNSASSLSGKEAIFGIRPEHVQVGSGQLQSNLTLVESLGTEKILHIAAPPGQLFLLDEAEIDAEGLERQTQSLLVRLIDDHRYVDGQNINLRFPIDKIRVFNGETQMALG